MLVNRNNTVYLANYQTKLLHRWVDGNSIPTTMNVSTSVYPYSIFVTTNEDIYVTSSTSYVDKWVLNSTNKVLQLYVTSGYCYDLFMDGNNSLYCSLYNSHKVIKRSLNNTDTQTITVAGTGCNGISPTNLYYPRGIFVDNSFNLYVADSSNHRIQVFPPGKLIGRAVAGREAFGTIILQNPTDVILDADGHLFIVDNGNYRIVASDFNGFRCIIGCSGQGNTADKFLSPQTMAFDRNGNIFVVDTSNYRIQKFLLATNSCSEYFIITISRSLYSIYLDATNISQQTSTTSTSTGNIFFNTVNFA